MVFAESMTVDVLLVDDTDADAAFIFRELRTAKPGLRLVRVRGGAEALEFLLCTGPYEGRSSGTPRLILLDVKMPPPDGLDVLRRLASDDTFKSIPVVMLTNSVEDQNIIESRRLGSRGYLVKPVGFKTLRRILEESGFEVDAADAPAATTDALYDIPVRKIGGQDATLHEHRGKVLLVVNVASKCGLTPQYEGLEVLQKKYVSQRFSVLGFPANDFAGQEPDDNAEIERFCTDKFGIQFPLYAKIAVIGPQQHPLYRHLTTQLPDAEDRERMESMLHAYNMQPSSRPDVLWNFEKFLIDRQGRVVRRFAPDTPPNAPQLVAAIEAELAKA